MVFLTEAYTLQHTWMELRVGLDTRKFVHLFAGQDVHHLFVEAFLMSCHFALYAAASLGDKHSLAILVHHAFQFVVHHALAKDEARRGLIIKILHTIVVLRIPFVAEMI